MITWEVGFRCYNLVHLKSLFLRCPPRPMLEDNTAILCKGIILPLRIWIADWVNRVRDRVRASAILIVTFFRDGKGRGITGGVIFLLCYPRLWTAALLYLRLTWFRITVRTYNSQMDCFCCIIPCLGSCGLFKKRLVKFKFKVMLHFKVALCPQKFHFKVRFGFR